MSQLHTTKKRIKSIDSTRKITKAMELVASVKLKKWQHNFENIEEYSATLESIISSCIGEVDENQTSLPLEIKTFPNAKNKLVVIVSSCFGLCGGYNHNIFKYADMNIHDGDKLVLIGTKAGAHYVDNDKDCSNEEILEKIDYTKVKNLISLLSREYAKGIYKSVEIIYTSFKNSLTFVPTTFTLFPIALENKESNDYEPIFEPNKKEFLQLLLPKYLQTILYSKLVESIVCEHSSRRNAMDNATDNADELVEKLTIQYNKARQASITNELIDVVSGARNS